MSTLYRFSTFVFSYEEFFEASEYQYTQLSWISLKRVMHVEIRLDWGLYDTRLSLEKNSILFSRFCEMSLGQLAMVEPSRKPSMTVTLRMDPAAMAYEDFEDILQSWPDEPLTPTLCALVGFQAVIVEWHHCCACTKRPVPPSTPMNPPCNAVRQFQAPDNSLWKTLEQALGPGVVEDVNLWRRQGSTVYSRTRPELLYRYYNCHRRRWIFDPWAFGADHKMRELNKLLSNRQRCADCNHFPYPLHPAR